MRKQLSVAENVNRALTNIARRMGGGSVRVGFLEGSTYPDGTPVAAVAFWDEYGHGGNFPAPARSFFRDMIKKESGKWPKKMADLAKANHYNGTKVLQLMGEDIAGALKKSIIDTNTPSLSETTIILRNRFGNNPQDITIMDVLKAQRFAATGRGSAFVASNMNSSLAKPLVWTGHMLASVGFEVKGEQFYQTGAGGTWEKAGA